MGQNPEFQPDGDTRASASAWERIICRIGIIDRVGKVAVFGAQGVGKTTLWESIQGRWRVQAEPTGMRRGKAGPAVIRVDGTRVVVPLGSDVGGNVEAINTYWEEEFLSADVVVYVFCVPIYLKSSRSSDYSHPDGQKKSDELRDDVRDHLVDMANWQAKRPKKWKWFRRSTFVPRLLLLGTWCDDYPGWDEAHSTTDTLIHKKLESDHRYQQTHGKLVAKGLVPQLLLGSLETQSSRTTLLENVVRWMRA
jgi:GTPase SAR1 family protein